MVGTPHRDSVGSAAWTPDTTLVERFGSWLKEGGFLLFTTESEEWADEVGDWLGAPMYFSQNDPDTTVRLLGSAGFELVSTNSATQLEGDREVEYVWYLAGRPRESGAAG